MGRSGIRGTIENRVVDVLEGRMGKTAVFVGKDGWNLSHVQGFQQVSH